MKLKRAVNLKKMVIKKIKNKLNIRLYDFIFRRKNYYWRIYHNPFFYFIVKTLCKETFNKRESDYNEISL